MGRKLSLGFFLAGLLVVAGASVARAQAVITYVDTDNNTTNYDTTAPNDPTTLAITSGSAEQSGVLSGTGAIIKTGAGTLTLSGNNTYGGGTSVTAGTLVANNNGALGYGSVIISSGATVDVSSSSNYDLSRFSGPGTLTASGTSFTNFQNYDVIVDTILAGNLTITQNNTSNTLTLTGANTFSGFTAVFSGTISVSQDANLGATSAFLELGGGSGTLATTDTFATSRELTLRTGGGILNVGGETTLTWNGIIDENEASSLTKTGFGALELTNGGNSFSQGLTVASGSVYIGASSTGAPGNVTSGPVGTGTLTFQNSSTLGAMPGTFTLGNDISLDNNGGNLTIDLSRGSLILSGIINETASGSSLTVTAGEGNSLTLSGQNGYSGGTTVQNGAILLLGASSVAPNVISSGPVGVSDVTLDDGATLGVSMAPPGPITLDNNIILDSGNATIDTTNGNLILKGAIHENNTASLTIQGGYALTLAYGGNDFTGGVTVNSGTLLLGASSNLDGTYISSSPIGRGDLTLYDGTMLGVATGTGPVTLANYIVLDPTPGTNVTFDTTGGSLTLIQTISGQAGITLTGANPLILSADNIFTGGVTVTNGSILQLGSSTKNVDGTVISDPGQISTGPIGTGTLTLNDGATLTTAGLDDVSLANNLFLPGTAGVTFDLSNRHTPDGTNYYYDALTLGGALTGSAPINLYGLGNSQDGYHAGGQLFIQGDNSGWSGGLNIYGNNYVGVYNQNGLGTGPLWFNPASSSTVEFTNGNPIIGGLSGGHSDVDYHSTVMVDDGTTLTINQNVAGSYDGIISGAGNINKDGGAQLTLTGANTYTGTTTITDGTLAVSDDSNLGAAPVSVTPGSLILSGGELEATSSFTLNANRGVTLNAAGGFFTDNGATLTYNGIIDGTGRLTKDGAGTLVLGGLNTFNGGVTLSGVLSISDDANLGLAPGSPTANDLRLSAGTIESTATLTLNANRGILLDDTGGTFLTDPGTTLTYNGVISSLSTGGLTKSGTGTLVLGGASNYTGGTTLSDGTLAVGNASALGTGTLSVPTGASYSPTFTTTTAGLTLTNPVNVTLTFGSAGVRFGGTYDFALSGALSGSGIIDKYGADNLSLIGSNSSFTGGINVLNGTLTVGADNAGGGPLSTIGVIGSEGPASLAFTSPAPSVGTIYAYSGTNITLASGTTLTVNQTWDTNIDGTISGNGSLVKSGPNTLTLTAANTYTGGTTISAGRLVAGNNSAFGTGSLTLNGGTLGIANGITLNNSLSFTGGTPTTLGGNGTIASHITADSHVILSPGNSPGSLGFTAGLTLASLGEYDWQLQSVAGAPLSGAGTNWDLISVSGSTLDLPTTGNFTLKVISLNSGGTAGSVSDFNSGSAYTWTIASSATGITGGVGNITIDTSQFANLPGSTGFSLSISGNDLNLNFTPVPEPSTYALLALGLGTIVLPVLRRRAG